MANAQQAPHAGKWKVEMDIGGEWENVWREEKPRKKGANGRRKEHPKVKFDSYQDAEHELQAHFKSMNEAGMDYDPDEYRIVPVIAH